MKKKFLLILLLLCVTTNVAFSGIFSDYDFTFYKTISQSLQVFDSTKIGFDYTGFGFLGTKQRSGLFIRFGFQTPFSMPSSSDEDTLNPDNSTTDATTPPSTSIPSITGPTGSSSSTSGSNKPSSNDTSDSDSHEKSEKEISSRNYSFTFIMGPASRIITSDRVNMYMGIGIRLSHNILFSTNPLINLDTVDFKTQIGIDLDVGGRIDINEKTSLRVGLYATSTLMTFDYLVDKADSKDKDGNIIKKPEPHASVFFDIFNPSSAELPISAHAYISMGTHFSSTWKSKVYRYEITSPKIFSGTLIELGAEE